MGHVNSVLISSTCFLYALTQNLLVYLFKISLLSGKSQLQFCIHFKNKISEEIKVVCYKIKQQKDNILSHLKKCMLKLGVIEVTYFYLHVRTYTFSYCW